MYASLSIRNIYIYIYIEREREVPSSGSPLFSEPVATANLRTKILVCSTSHRSTTLVFCGEITCPAVQQAARMAG